MHKAVNCNGRVKLHTKKCPRAFFSRRAGVRIQNYEKTSRMVHMFRRVRMRRRNLHGVLKSGQGAAQAGHLVKSVDNRAAAAQRSGTDVAGYAYGQRVAVDFFHIGEECVQLLYEGLRLLDILGVRDPQRNLSAFP